MGAGRPSTPLSIPPWFDCGSPAALRLARRWRDFQSHLGSIAAGDTGHELRPLLHFQSHLGSIAARPHLAIGHPGAGDFQSHLGSIAAWPIWGKSSTLPALSIPPWFDCGLYVQGLGFMVNHLSIPPWFDCGIWRRLSVLGHILGFQSHLGSIAARSAARRTLTIQNFQSHLGSIAAV